MNGPSYTHPRRRGRLKKAILSTVGGTGVLVVAIGVLIGTQAAHAAAAPLTDSQLVTPAIQNAHGSFYTEAQIDEVWKAVTTHYPQPLPAGITFPASAPSFFHSNGTSARFQTGLPDEIAAQYWKCAWLDQSIDAAQQITAKGTGPEASLKALSSATQKLGEYVTLPSIASLGHVETQKAAVAKYAKSQGISSLSVAEFQMECGGFSK